MKLTPAEDRRKSKRFNGLKKTILIHPNGIGHVSDISAGGLSFHCSHEEFFTDQWSVDIVLAGTSLYMTGVPVQFVSEREDDVINFLTPPSKKVGVKFVTLDDQNRYLLAQLISFLEDGSTN